jgi:hypothetical protein
VSAFVRTDVLEDVEVALIEDDDNREVAEISAAKVAVTTEFAGETYDDPRSVEVMRHRLVKDLIVLVGGLRRGHVVRLQRFLVRKAFIQWRVVTSR